ncbi:MAG: cytochrome c biogenesis protein CcsA [Pseudomonadota bacterium]
MSNTKIILSKNYNSIIKLYQYSIFTLFLIFAILTTYHIYTAPYDYQHNIYTLLLYLHAPIAWTGINLYIINCLNTIINLFYSNNISLNITKSIALPNLIFLTLTLFTGSIWGKNSWGTYWVWDARLTSVFILFIFYIIQNFIIITQKNYDHFKIDILNILSCTIIPIIIFSVNIWHTLHQGSSIQSNGISYEILTPLKFAAITFHLYAYIICHARFNQLHN